MPFMYELALAEGEQEYTVLQHLVAAGMLVGTGQAVAVLSDGVMEYHLPAPRQGLLVAWFAQSGSKVHASQPIARIVCEGESVTVPAASPMRLG